LFGKERFLSSQIDLFSMIKGLLNRRTVFSTEDGTSFKILLEQATYEVHKGAYNLAMQYLNKALKVTFQHLYTIHPN